MNNTVGLLSNRRLKSNKRPSYDVMFVLNAPCRTESPPPPPAPARRQLSHNTGMGYSKRAKIIQFIQFLVYPILFNINFKVRIG